MDEGGPLPNSAFPEKRLPVSRRTPSLQPEKDVPVMAVASYDQGDLVDGQASELPSRSGFSVPGPRNIDVLPVDLYASEKLRIR